MAVRLAMASTARDQRILSVDFMSADGYSWTAVGGGETIAEASTGRACCPPDRTWEPVGREDLHSD
jgi:hypothetical protein